MDAFTISVSHGLQYGVPLRASSAPWSGCAFEPAGMTDDPEVRIANSLVDYLFRRLALEYIPTRSASSSGSLACLNAQPTLPASRRPPRRPFRALTRQPIRLPCTPCCVGRTHPDCNGSPLRMTWVQMTRAGSCLSAPKVRHHQRLQLDIQGCGEPT